MDPDLRAERYGAPRAGRRRLALVVVAAVALLGLGWVAWVMVSSTRAEASSQLQSYDVPGVHKAVATVVVGRSSPDVRATCLLRAYGVDHAAVGETAFTLGPGDPESSRLTLTVRTERRAVQVVSVGCTTPGQARPR